MTGDDMPALETSYLDVDIEVPHSVEETMLPDLYVGCHLSETNADYMRGKDRVPERGVVASVSGSGS